MEPKSTYYIGHFNANFMEALHPLLRLESRILGELL